MRPTASQASRDHARQYFKARHAAKRDQRERDLGREARSLAEIMPGEEWRAVSGYEGIYEVSNTGRVRSVRRTYSSWIGKILKLGKGGGKRGGPSLYRIAVLAGPNGRKNIGVHRLVARAFIGEPPSPKHEVNHKDGDPNNNRADNLEWVTKSQNHLHALHVIERWPSHSKLTLEQIHIIRTTNDTGVSLAKRFAVSNNAISRARRYISFSRV